MVAWRMVRRVRSNPDVLGANRPPLMPRQSNVPEDPIEEARRGFRAMYNPRGSPAVMMVTGLAWDNLVSRSHKCFLHQDLPIVVVETFSADEWAYHTPPARLEVSQELMEEIRTWKGTITQYELERLLDSTRRRYVEVSRMESIRKADQLKGITD